MIGGKRVHHQEKQLRAKSSDLAKGAFRVGIFTPMTASPACIPQTRSVARMLGLTVLVEALLGG